VCTREVRRLVHATSEVHFAVIKDLEDTGNFQGDESVSSEEMTLMLRR